MIVHCTKKLASYLGVDSPVTSSRIENSHSSGIGDWHGNIYTFGRQKLILFIHDQTRYCVIIPLSKMSDVKKLRFLFEDVFINSLIKAGMPSQVVEKAAASLGNLQLDTVCSRSVQGTMSRIAEELEWTLQMDGVRVAGITPYSLSSKFSHRPTTAKGRKDYFWPDDEMREWLSNL